jgi:hypothetical protein
VAPGASASSMIRAFSSGGHTRRRSAIETISSPFLSVTVLTHVRKDSKPHDPHRRHDAAIRRLLPAGNILWVATIRRW